jgi:hypothetical protein
MLAGLFVRPRLTQPGKTSSQRAEWLEMKLGTLVPILWRCCSSQIQPSVRQAMTGIETNCSAGECGAFFTLKTRHFDP